MRKPFDPLDEYLRNHIGPHIGARVSCTECRGMGTVLQSIDEERHPVEGVCPLCQRVCPYCDQQYHRDRHKSHKCPKRPVCVASEFDPPPVPDRGCDWRAWIWDEEDEGMVIGWGRTQQNAILDLLDRLEED